MPWWSWLVMWVALALALLGMLMLLAFRLFRKGLAVLGELEVLASKLQLLDREGDELDGQQRQLAVLLGASKMRERRDLVRAAALHRKARRHDARLVSARGLIAVDASTREWFKAR